MKRKNGLFKKAYELGVLCSVDVAVIVFEERPGHHLKLYQYGSSDIHEILQRHLHHDGEKDTRGPADFSGAASGTKLEDMGEAEDEEEEHDDHPMPRGLKRRGDGQLKHSTELMSDIEYAPPRVLSHPQHPPRQVHPSMSMSQHPRHSQQHQHPVSSDRLGPMHQDKKPRLGIAPSPGLAYSRSSSDDHIPSAISPISTARSGRYHHSNGHDSMVRSSYGVPPPYMPSHSSHSNHHPSSSVHHNSHGHHSHNQPPPPQHQRHSNQQYPPFFPTSGPGVGGPHYGDSPPSPSFIPLPSNGDYDTSSRGRSTNAGFPPPRNVYSSYSGDGGPSGGSGGGGSGDLFAAFMDAEHQARTTSIARRSSMSSSAAFGLEWPVHMNSDVPDSHPKSSGSHSGSGSSERDLGDRGGSAGSSAGGNGGGPGGADWLEFLAGNSGNVAAAG